ncbi:hypothetical protein SARC_04294 [Sphaeroforma arctica JP610]|uniref:Uncharacterized protein n=1 Tax=Sphaeroforma arctica JP610 TaxID=667725 RepID=A0A0L0G5B2_9EUKA|nr:hypothetical protein SARC_04294 [Sphaeroforma arctica JP610]KNC83453.1 hypothetical protein SARC_04294 [Sphaeroforma arctica JP610]|eukprot:XP_014157355.1 hypothetical protein SARC_04294 [Sphaeroforma arctica JP610]
MIPVVLNMFCGVPQFDHCGFKVTLDDYNLCNTHGSMLVIIDAANKAATAQVAIDVTDADVPTCCNCY